MKFPSTLPSSARVYTALVFFAGITLFVGGINYGALIWSQSKIIEHEAIRIAEVVTSHALGSRSVFTKEVVAKSEQDGFGSDEHFRKRRGFVPIPAQFLKFVANEVSASNEGLYSYKPLSKWNMELTQGLEDEFQRWAWSELEKQDQPRPAGPLDWQPVWRYEEVDGIRMLRYMSADAAQASSCVECHNRLELRPDIVERRLVQGIAPRKQWQQHQLMGALEVRVPVDQIERLAASQAKTTLSVVLSTSLGGMLLAGLLAWRNIRRERANSAYFERQALIDPLTRLLNRVGLEESAEALIRKARATNGEVSVFFIDLDGFKPVNDTYGHRVGDELLKLVAGRIRSVVRGSDIVGRQGGDEFLVIMEENLGSGHFEKTAGQLLDVLSKPFFVEGHEVVISASIGISSYPQHGEALVDLVRKADQAMYEAKSMGRAAHVVFSEGSR